VYVPVIGLAEPFDGELPMFFSSDQSNFGYDPLRLGQRILFTLPGFWIRYSGPLMVGNSDKRRNRNAPFTQTTGNR
jgi:hypothetical protein